MKEGVIMANFRMEKKRNRRKKWLKAIFLSLFVMIILAGSTVAYLAIRVQNVTSSSPELVRGVKSEMREEAVKPSQDNFSILFLGVDDRDGTLQGRTDALILATFNPEEGTVKMVSIPRDSLVEIPGRINPDKINHAHAYGGIDLAIETVEKLFDIPVDYYVRLNFTAFIEIVDALGGVEIDVPFTFSEQDSQDRRNAITLYEGVHTLNGEEALAFARMRKHDPTGDIGRGARQQEVIKAILKKGATISSITKYGEVLESLENHLTTNISFTHMLALHKYSDSLGEIETFTLEGTSTSISGVYYYDLVDDSLEHVKHELKVHLGLEKTTPETEEENSEDEMMSETETELVY